VLKYLLSSCRYRPSIPEATDIPAEPASKAPGVILDTKTTLHGASADDDVTALIDGLQAISFDQINSELSQEPSPSDVKPKPKSMSCKKVHCNTVITNTETASDGVSADDDVTALIKGVRTMGLEQKHSGSSLELPPPDVKPKPVSPKKVHRRTIITHYQESSPSIPPTHTSSFSTSSIGSGRSNFATVSLCPIYAPVVKGTTSKWRPVGKKHINKENNADEMEKPSVSNKASH
jgi:hypothetical protein